MRLVQASRSLRAGGVQAPGFDDSSGMPERSFDPDNPFV